MIFVDTWAWVALADCDDPYHEIATAEHGRLAKQRVQYLTTDWVLGETITYLYDALAANQARSFIESVLAAGNNGAYRLLRLTNDQFDRA